MSEILDRIYPDNESQLFFTEIADHRKYIIELEQQLQQAHHAGWEQAKREAYSLSQQHSLLSSTKSGEIEINELAIAIANLEYKEPTNEY